MSLLAFLVLFDSTHSSLSYSPLLGPASDCCLIGHLLEAPNGFDSDSIIALESFTQVLKAVKQFGPKGTTGRTPLKLTSSRRTVQKHVKVLYSEDKYPDELGTRMMSVCCASFSLFWRAILLSLILILLLKKISHLNLFTKLLK